MMKLTVDQTAAVLEKGNSLVVACPGSGKTRVLVAKLLRCAREVEGTARRIACITYTNAAVYEIESRLRVYGTGGEPELCDVSTIHSFCLEHILRHFHWRIPEYRDGFSVLPPDDELYREIAEGVCRDHGLRAYPRDKFEQINREADGTSICAPPLNENMVIDFWSRLQAQGLIDFPNIVYHSLRLLLDWPGIVRALSARYAWVLIDEFQDTSTMQVRIMEEIATTAYTKFFLVGDPHQSIYRFAGAHPNLMHEFGKKINARQDFRVLVNFRSSKRVIAHAERLCPRMPAMSAGGENADVSIEPLYYHVSSSFQAMTDYFLPALEASEIEYGEAAVLAPWWVTLLHLGRGLREYGIPIVGPGARPYKRTHLFARLAEQICGFIEYPNPAHIRRVERELFNLIIEVTGSADFRVYSYDGRRVVYTLIQIGKALREASDSGVLWLERASGEFSAVLEDEGLLPSSCTELMQVSVSGMIADMIERGVDTANLTTADLGIFAHPERNLSLLTMHGAKGREFDAVAIVDLHDGKVPDYRSSHSDDIEESRRLLYVAITRARKLLMYFTDNGDYRNRPSRFLGQQGLGLLN